MRAFRKYGVRIGCLFCACIFSGFMGCYDSAPVSSPPGYHLDAPKKFILGDALHEISGIVMLQGNSDTLYAIEDEQGRLFYFHPGDGKYSYQKFGKRGDYEDVTIVDDKEFAVLRSDGSLFIFPLSLVRDGNADQVEKYEGILPKGEYEGLFGDGNGRLIALCKNCPDDDQKEEVSGYVLQRVGKNAGGTSNAAGTSNSLTITEHFKVDVSMLKLTDIHKKAKFHPSCLARHPLTHEWYIISSVNKILLVLDDRWKVKAGYPLSPSLFKQPEGLAFDRKGNMYISNEGGPGGDGNVLLFAYLAGPGK